MSNVDNPEYLLSHQYNDAANLQARANLHARFSTNPQGWENWVTSHFNFPAEATILELGCGPAWLWTPMLDRLPPGWQITLSDFSAGMLAQARHNLGRHASRFQFEQINAQTIPYPAGQFDIVIANHMLYHVPDRAEAIREIHRVLKPGGRLFATTVGQRHNAEIMELVARFDPAQRDVIHSGKHQVFSLENGPEQLAAVFPEVIRVVYPDTLAVTEVAPLVDYLCSLAGFVDTAPLIARRDALTAMVKKDMALQGGVFHVTKQSGLLMARKALE